jgi:hypothetical protein
MVSLLAAGSTHVCVQSSGLGHPASSKASKQQTARKTMLEIAT